ncbi:Odorant receptor 058 [Nylanderia fulva]|uniref:Odorant receptor n=2 Tax=Nylanderia fulva TaxID=613905 RepID=A0A6G1LP45_9HYME|nr:Odorant receptor 058 [Nylanderia fulva]
MDTSESSRYRDFVWATQLNRLSLELVGLWPKTDGIVKRRLGPDFRAGFAFIMITFVSGIPMIHALMRVWGDMTLMIENLRITLPTAINLLKLVVMRWKQSVLLSILNMIKEDWMTLNVDTERDTIVKRMRIVRMIVISAYVLMTVTFIAMISFSFFGLSFRHLTNLTDGNKPFLLQAYYFYDTDKSPLFEFTYFTQILALFQMVVIYVSVDSFFGFVICHICGQLENFRCQLDNLVAGKEFNKALGDNVMTHLRLIRYVDQIEDIFTSILLGSLIYFAIVFCLAGFMFVVVISNEKINAASFSRLYYSIAAIIILFSQMFFYCYAGELLTEQCEANYRAVYNLDWYKWEPKQMRNLVILMIRIQKPFRITAGKIVPLTMTTFCSLIKTSVGYVSFLLTIQN